MIVELDPREIADRTFDWLSAELITTSHNGVNHELNEYERTRNSYLCPTADNQNKVESHYIRFNELLGRVAATPEPYADDRLVATVGHHILMQVAGAYRLDSNLKAKSQGLYDFLHAGKGFAIIGLPDRQMTPACVDLKKAASAGLVTAKAFEKGREVTQLIRYGKVINEEIYKKFTQTQDIMIEAGAVPGKAFAPEHEVIDNMHDVQNYAVSFAAAHFMVAALLRDSKEDIPILQPDALHLVKERDLIKIFAEAAPQYE